ncbi:MAG: NfeD family protein [Pseudomonadales bacterium]
MRLFGLLIVAISFVLFSPNGAAAEVRLVRIEGPIGPALSDYFIRAVDDAQSQASAVVMIMDTPGGLDQSMRDMIKSILSSQIPIVAYVHPNGSRAASAGTYLMYASHIAAMAPATNIGSSTPVQLGGGSPFTPGKSPFDPPSDGDPDSNNGSVDKTQGLSAMERKVINDAVSYLRSLAELRGRNVDWAEETVRTGANLTAKAALAGGVIDVIAEDLAELLEEIDGRVTKVAEGKEVGLQTAGANVVEVPLDWRHQFLATITNPNIAYLMLMVGLYGLIIEFYNPGVGVAGVVGVTCLLLAGFALQMLPVNYAGLGLMVFGIALMIAEAVSPSFGIFGLGGVAAFVLGSILLMDTALPGYRISMALIGTLAATSAAVFVFAIAAALRARSRPVVTGSAALLTAHAQALEAFAREGHVRALGEVWQARSEVPIERGQTLKITAIDGLILNVTPME